MKNAILLGFAIGAASFLLFGCSVSKHTAKKMENTSVDSSAIYRTLLQTAISERDAFEKRVNELEYLSLTFVDCPDMDSLRAVVISSNCKNIDSVLRILDSYRSEVKRNADGSIEVKGRISSLTQTKSKLEEILATKESVITQLRDSLSKKEVKIETVIKTKDRIVEKTSWWWLWLIPVTVFATLWVQKRFRIIADRMSEARSRIS